MTAKTFASLVVVVVALFPKADAQNDHTGTRVGVSFAMQYVPVERFTAEALIAIGKRQARSHPGFLNLWFFTSKKDSDEFWGGPFTTWSNYSMWVIPYRKLSRRPWNVARFVGWEGSAVFQMRDIQGGIYRRVVYGSDLMRFDVDGVSAEIVSFGLRAASESVPVPDLAVFVKSDDKPSVSMAVNIWERFRKLDVRDLDVEIRTRPWFVDSVLAPVFDPFHGSEEVPNEADVKRLGRAFCIGMPSVDKPTCKN